MSLLGASGLSFRYSSGDPLFADATFSLNPGERAAIVGANGSGKSTLLRILAGELDPGGGVLVRRRGLRITLGQQQIAPDPHTTLFAFVAAGMDPEQDADREVRRMLGSLGFAAGHWTLSLDRLSGGERTRAGLARALLSGCDLLLLDEPTNHLDLAARTWLDGELARRRGASVIVSHDRTLLRRFAHRVIELERGKVRVFEGGYDEYRERRALLERQAWAGYEASERRRAAAEAAAAKRAKLADKVAAAPPGAHHSHDFYRRKAAKVARTARILRERTEWEGRAAKPWEEQGIGDVRFDDVPRSSDVVLDVRGLSQRYGEAQPLFRDLSFYLRRGGRLAILGANGSGKTTLLDILEGRLEATAGEVRRGANVTVGRFTQDSLDLDPARSALAHCGTDTRARTLLACLKLRVERWNSPARELSAGERTKVALARLLAQSRANLLLLDEPTNHLEVEAQEALEQALARYPGALVVVSHDRAFLDALGPGLERMELSSCDPLLRISSGSQ